MERRYTGYAADYERVAVTIDGDGSRTEARELFRLYQDAKGRTRMEGSISGQGQTLRFAWLMDLRRWHGVFIDLDSGNILKKGSWPGPGAAHRQVAAPPATVPTEARINSAPEPQTVEDLGEAEVEGLAARGTGSRRRATSSTCGMRRRSTSRPC